MNTKELLYSRQTIAYGSELSKSISSLKCLVIGMSGVGAEACKALSLAGVNEITLFDNGSVVESDIQACLYYKPADIGMKRLVVCIPHLESLNPFVKIKVHSENITEEEIKLNDIILVSKTELVDIDQIQLHCRKHKKGLIIAETFGYVGTLFVDFGEEFLSNNEFGAEFTSIPIESISKSNPAIIKTCIRHRLYDDDLVSFQSMNGMNELSNQLPQKVRCIDETTFEIDANTENFSDFINGNIIQVPVPRVFNFKSWSTVQVQPMLINTNSSKDKNNKQTHIFFRALRDYFKIHGDYPSISNPDEIEQCYNCAQEINEVSKSLNQFYVENLDKDLALKCFKFSKIQSAAICSIFGNLAAQEAIKFFHVYSPLENLLYLNFYELYTEELENYYLKMNDSIFFNKAKLFKIFIIGAGALGCEYLKLLALQGVGDITITDSDNIETSNLNRQFLFRNHDIGKNKSLIATNAIRNYRDINIKPYELKACPETEICFTDDFYDNQDLILSAVDTVDARKYLGEKSILHKKLFFNSGTDRLQANSEVIIPDVTNTYSSSEESGSGPKALTCTIKRNPYLIEHCIAWSKEKFITLFEENPKLYNLYLDDPENFLEKQSNSHADDSISIIKLYSEIHYFANVEVIKKVSYYIFYEYYNRDIIQIINLFPEDHTIDGAKYWAPPNRYPKPIEEFDLNCIKSIFKLICELIDLKLDSEFNDFDLEDVKVENICFNTLYQVDKSKPKLKLIEFDKDNDNHIDFIHYNNNLRAKCYQIDPCERYFTKKISGNINPSISATGAIITSLNMIEILKQLLNINVQNRNNYMINLIYCEIRFVSLNRELKIFHSEKEEIEPKDLTRWNKIEFDGNLLFQEVLQTINAKFDVSVRSLSHGNKQILDCLESKKRNMMFFEPDSSEDKLSKKLNCLKMYKNHKYMLLKAFCLGKDRKRVIIPHIQINFTDNTNAIEEDHY